MASESAPDDRLTQAIRLVREIGFPAVIAFFVLWRLEGAMRENTQKLAELREAILLRSPAHSTEK